MHLNIHSLPAKHEQLEMLLTHLEQNNTNVDFILLCERFLNDQNQHMYGIPGYQLITSNRKANIRGGVAIFVKK